MVLQLPSAMRALILAPVIFAVRVVADVPSPADQNPTKPAAVSTLTTSDLAEFDTRTEGVRELISRALELTKLNLTYTFGSSDTKRGGMDCSGTIYRLLQDCRLTEAPRQSDELCLWIKDKGALHLTPTATAFDNAEFAALEPGDLVFWTSTSSDRKLPISHVMLYLGKRKADGKPVLFGASDGRRYDGQSRCGVSVFDFEVPKPGSKATIYGYGPVTGLIKEEIRKPDPAPKSKAKAKK